MACERHCWSLGPSLFLRKSGGCRRPNGVVLRREKRSKSQIREIKKFAEVSPLERLPFRCGLDLNKRAITRADDVAVDCRAAVLDVIEIQHRHAPYDANTHRSDRREQWIPIQSSLPAQSVEGDG